MDSLTPNYCADGGGVNHLGAITEPRRDRKGQSIRQKVGCPPLIPNMCGRIPMFCDYPPEKTLPERYRGPYHGNMSLQSHTELGKRKNRVRPTPGFPFNCHKSGSGSIAKIVRERSNGPFLCPEDTSGLSSLASRILSKMDTGTFEHSPTFRSERHGYPPSPDQAGPCPRG